jgi:hypothetical protein
MAAAAAAAPAAAARNAAEAPNPLWAVPVLGAILAALAFPVLPGALAALLAACAALVWRYPLAAVPVLLAAMPALDLAPWSGRYHWDEFDLLLAVCIGTVLLRLPPALHRTATDRLFRVAMALLLASLAISTVRALLPWQWPDANAFYGYFGPFNALRIAKGAVWALLTLAMLRRLANHGLDLGAAVVAGMCAGLALTVAFMLWERWAFVGLLDVAADYRATGPFSAMHKGGAYVECYLAMATPFAFALIVRARGWAVRAFGAALVLAASYAVMVTYSRNGYAALLLAVLAYLGLAWRGRSRRGAAVAAVLAIVAAAVAAPVLLGPFARERLASARSDLEVRRAHWADALALRDDDLATSLFGVGLGRFPESHYWRSREPVHAATFSLGAEPGRHFLRLGPGSPLYFQQIVPAEHGRPYTLALRLRAPQPAAGLVVWLCEKWMLTSADCSSARLVAPAAGAWQEVRARLELPAAAESSRAAWRPVQLALQAPAQAPAIDVADVRLEADDGTQLLRNGDFERGLDRWFFAADVDLPWHIHSLPVGVLFDQGWFGVVAWTLVLLVALGRGLALARAGHAAQIAATAALAAFLVSASLNTLIDAPRFLWVVLVVGGLCGPLVLGEAAQRRALPQARRTPAPAGRRPRPAVPSPTT